MGEAIVQRCRSIGQRNQRNNNNWRWGDYFVEFSSDCGITVECPDKSTRLRFAFAMHAVISVNEYSLKTVFHTRLELVEAILAFHGRSAEVESAPDSAG